ATLDPEGILSHSQVRGVCVGEGEIPLEQLLQNIAAGKDITTTEGFYWKMGEHIKKNRIPSFLPEPLKENFPDYSIFDPDLVVYEGHLYAMLSRGCPYACYYCCNKALAGVYESSEGYFRLPPVEASIRFLEEMIRKYPKVEFIGFEDD